MPPGCLTALRKLKKLGGKRLKPPVFRKSQKTWESLARALILEDLDGFSHVVCKDLQRREEHDCGAFSNFGRSFCKETKRKPHMILNRTHTLFFTEESQHVYNWPKQKNKITNSSKHLTFSHFLQSTSGRFPSEAILAW